MDYIVILESLFNFQIRYVMDSYPKKKKKKAFADKTFSNLLIPKL